mgnify:CR=1 FL=1
MELNRILGDDEIQTFLQTEIPGQDLDEEGDNIERAYSLERRGFGIKARDYKIENPENPRVVIPSGKMDFNEQEHCFTPIYLGGYTKEEINKKLMNFSSLPFSTLKRFKDASAYLATVEEYLPDFT